MRIFDIHTHGIGGFHTKSESADDILKIAEIHGSYGVSDIIPTIYPSSIESMRNNIHAVKKAMEIQQSLEETGSTIHGVYLEGPFLNPAKCGALDASSFLAPHENSFRELVEGFEDIIKIITVAPELDGALKLIKTITDMGILVSMGHSDATFTESQKGYNSGARGITHLFNAMKGIHHREPGLAGFGLINKDIYVEIITDPYHIDQELIDFIFRVKNTDRIIIISDSVRDSVIADHSDGIRNGRNTLIGGSKVVTESVNLLISRGINRENVMSAVSSNPERYLDTFK